MNHCGYLSCRHSLRFLYPRAPPTPYRKMRCDISRTRICFKVIVCCISTLLIASTDTDDAALVLTQLLQQTSREKKHILNSKWQYCTCLRRIHTQLYAIHSLPVAVTPMFGFVIVCCYQTVTSCNLRVVAHPTIGKDDPICLAFRLFIAIAAPRTIEETGWWAIKATRASVQVEQPMPMPVPMLPVLYMMMNPTEVLLRQLHLQLSKYQTSFAPWACTMPIHPARGSITTCLVSWNVTCSSTNRVMRYRLRWRTYLNSPGTCNEKIGTMSFCSNRTQRALRSF